jgi:NAD(P)-dependent dehydrogenase (short-subunit alcohol dehydrogenase family)
MLKNKVAVIYGAGGAVGSAVARAFGREGATLFLTGRRRASLDDVAKEIASSGGIVETAEVNALDEQSVDKHLRSAIDKVGRVDISFNGVGIPNTTLQGVPLVDLEFDQFSLPISTYTTAYFLTARLAARRMVAQKAGVIMTVTPLPARAGLPLLGGFAPAMSAVEGLTRGLSAELAPHGIRVVGLRTDGMPDSGTINEVFGIHAKAYEMTWQQFHDGGRRQRYANPRARRCARRAWTRNAPGRRGTEWRGRGDRRNRHCPIWPKCPRRDRGRKEQAD